MSNDEPFNPYTKTRRLSNGQSSPVVDCTIEHPSHFCERNAAAQTSPSPNPLPHGSRGNPQRLSIPPRHTAFANQTNFMPSPASPTTDGLTEFTPPTSADLSRSSSSICGAINMMKIESQSSFKTSSPLDPYGSFSASDQFGFHASLAKPSHLVDYTGGMADDTSISRIATYSTNDPFAAESSDTATVAMKRSNSIETKDSVASISSFHSQQSPTRGTRKIAPKAFEIGEPMSRHSSASGHEVIRRTSLDGTVKEVVSIAKAPYVRPQHDKILCTYCNEKPGGFRGEHELRRHTERAHSVRRKAFVCKDISTDGQFLAKCKACMSGKRYNAYYNAAAHLRRVHFNPKPKGGRKSKAKSKEPRGGKGGGDSPAMEVCRMWMEEIEEMVAPDAAPYDDTEHDDEESKSTQYDPLPEPHSNREQFDTSMTEYAPTSAIDILAATHQSSAAFPLSFSAPVPQTTYDSMSLNFSQPRQASDVAGLLDLSHDVSMYELANNASANMSLTSNPQLCDGFEDLFSFNVWL